MMNRILNSGWSVFLLVVCVDFSVPAATCYVDAYSTNPVSPFASWATAATNIVEAVAATQEGDAVLVSNGLYYIAEEIKLTNGITLQSVNGADKTEITSGSQCRGIYMDGSNILVEGFTIRDCGNVTTEASTDYGGGIACFYGTVRDCIISNNSCYHHDVVSSYGGGGGVFCSAGLVERCVLCENQSTQPLSINEAGGGIFVRAGGRINQCVIFSNYGNWGAGVRADNGILEQSLIYGNIANQSVDTAEGGGVFCQGSLIRNCTIVGNSSIAYSSYPVTSSNSFGAGIYVDGDSELVNCIIYGNSATNGSDLYVDDGVNLDASGCCTYPLLEGSNNIICEPRFIDEAGGNYRLAADSPCINAGVNQGWMAYTTDLDGSNRVVGPRVDMGAYESGGEMPPILCEPNIYVSHTGSNIYPYLSWETAATNLLYALQVVTQGIEIVVGDGVYSLTNETGQYNFYPGYVLRSQNGYKQSHLAFVSFDVLSNAVLSGFTIDTGNVNVADGGIVENCEFNQKWQWHALTGGAAYNCLFYDCNCERVVKSSTVVNCAFVDNYCSFFPPGERPIIKESLIINCIIYSNRYNTLEASTTMYSCVQGTISGIGNTTNSPMFVDWTNDFRLLAGSPCIDTGSNVVSAMGRLGLDGVGRPLDGDNNGSVIMDMGAYEYVHSGADSDQDGITDGDEVGTYGTQPNEADTDADGMSDPAEVDAGTDPLDEGSYLGVLMAELDGSSDQLVLEWLSASNRTYQIGYITNLLASDVQIVHSNITATPMLNTYTVSTDSAESYRVYRVQLQE